MAIWKKETVKDFEGKDIEIELVHLGGRKRDMYLDEYIKTKFTSKGSGDNEADIDYKPYTLKAKVMEEHVKGIETNNIELDEYDRIFETYYKKAFGSIFGGGEELKN